MGKKYIYKEYLYYKTYIQKYIYNEANEEIH